MTLLILLKLHVRTGHVSLKLLFIVSHLLLKNHGQWLKNDSEHCSAGTKKHPVTNIFDGTLFCIF